MKYHILITDKAFIGFKAEQAISNVLVLGEKDVIVEYLATYAHVNEGEDLRSDSPLAFKKSANYLKMRVREVGHKDPVPGLVTSGGVRDNHVKEMLGATYKEVSE